jgi:hypothetical protein
MSPPSPLAMLSNALKIADKVIGRAGGGREQNSPEFSRVGRRADPRQAPGDYGRGCKGRIYLLRKPPPAKFEQIDQTGLPEAGYGPEDFG